MGHHEVQEGRPPVLDALVLEEHQEIRRRGHQFPGDQEEEGIISKEHQEHAGEKKSIKSDQGRHRAVPDKGLHVTDGVDRDENGKQADDNEEEAGKEVEAQMKRKIRQAGGQDQGLDLAGGNGPYTGNDRAERREGQKRESRGNKKFLVQTKQRRYQEKEQQEQKREKCDVKRCDAHALPSLNELPVGRGLL